MKPKMIKLIRILSDYTEFVTASSLAANMDVSTRSIKSYIQEINSFYPDAIESSREGYRIDKQAARRILEESGTHIPQSSQERIVYIINSLIKSDTSVNTYDLCDEMYVSYSTIKNDLQAVKSRLRKYDLQLNNNHDNLTVSGLEKNKRRLLSSILYDESNVNFVNLETIQNIFPEIEIELIKDSLLEIFDRFHYFVNDYSLINLVLHITIAIDRIRNRNVNTEDIHDMPPSAPTSMSWPGTSPARSRRISRSNTTRPRSTSWRCSSFPGQRPSTTRASRSPIWEILSPRNASPSLKS